jgi:uncharacterized protein YdaU (DUF1376 family)
MSTGNSLAMMPWFPRDWLTATRLMSLAERGAYSDLLFYQWELGKLPTKREALLRLLGCSEAEFNEVWITIGPKFVVNGQSMHNEKLEEHRAKSKQLKSDKSLAGKAGGIKSGEARRSKREADPQAAANGFASSKTPSKTQAPSPSPSPYKKNPKSEDRLETVGERGESRAAAARLPGMAKLVGHLKS